LSDAVTSPGSCAVSLTSLPLLQAIQPDLKGCPLANTPSRKTRGR